MRHILFFVSLLNALIVFGQPDKQDTAFLSIARNNVIRSFTQGLDAHAGLYNGREYSEYRQTGEEHPYLFLDWTEGSIMYFGKVYDNVPLLFDLSTNEIVTEHSSGNKISLLREKVNYFMLKDHRFEYLHESGLSNGFYDIIYSGRNIKIIAKRLKIKRERIAGTTLSIDFEEQTKYFLIKESQSFPLSNKRSLIKILGSEDPQIRKKLSAEILETSKENTFLKLGLLYDQLMPAK